MNTNSKEKLKVFYCYAHEDKELRDELDKHLSILKRQGYITSWYDYEISPGKNWQKEIDMTLKTAHIILLLISPDFLNSEYCYSIEMKEALKRHEEGLSLVIPIILRPVDWEDEPFSHLLMLPPDGEPITLWQNRDEALSKTAKGIKKAIGDFFSATTINNHQEIKIHINRKNNSAKKPRRRTQPTNQFCENCGIKNSVRTDFCWNCGMPIMKPCASCGQLNPQDRIICWNCQVKLLLQCNHCQEKNPLDFEICWNCGLPISTICSHCQEPNSIDNRNCQNCNSLLFQICPNCNIKNNLKSTSCQNCGLPLIQICLSCSATNDLERIYCHTCYFTFTGTYKTQLMPIQPRRMIGSIPPLPPPPNHKNQRPTKSSNRNKQR